MNGFLWLGVVCTIVLVVAVIFDGLDEAFDALSIGPGWLSLPAIAAFLAATGFVAGALVAGIGALAVVPGLAAGLGLGWFAAWMSSAVGGFAPGRTDSEAAMLGSLGQVVTAPTAAGYGEVLLDRPEGPVKVACTAAEVVTAGTEVVVIDVVSSTLVAVQSFDPLRSGELDP